MVVCCLFDFYGVGVLRNCSFVCCNASYGGAVYWNGTKGIVGNCSFVNCSAPSADGGAIYWYDTNDGSIVNCTNGALRNCSFVCCNASYGGAIYWNGTKGIVGNCSFMNCSASGMIVLMVLL